jgi:hypothetical protein
MDGEDFDDDESILSEVAKTDAERSIMFVLFITNDKGVLLMRC